MAPATGFVHVRDGATLEHDSYLTVHATDRNGQGLNGSIDIVVSIHFKVNVSKTESYKKQSGVY